MSAPNENGAENGSSGGFPGVRSLFSRKGFPGTVKLSRHSGSTSESSSRQASGILPSASEDAVAAMSSLAVKDQPTTTQDQTTSQLPEASSSPHTTTSSPPPNRSTTSTPTAAAAKTAASPSQTSNNGSPTPTQTPSASGGVSRSTSGVSVSVLRSMSEPRVAKFQRILNEPVVDVEALRELAWSGIPPNLRPLCWRLLLGYLPPNRERRDQILARKRREYRELIPEYYESAAGAVAAAGGSAAGLRATEEESALRQVAVDVPRTAPGVPFFHLPRMQKTLERILYIWGVRHPASGYVQGINDLATPFLAVFTSEKMQNDDISTWTSLDHLTESEILDVEADCYWCLCKLLDGIQDHYTYSQPGIQKTLFHVMELVARVEAPTAAHLEKEGVEYMQFAFRWTNCLLLRELPFRLGQRLWDTYLAEGAALKEFLVYVLSSFLLSWAPQLKEMEFQDLIMFLQRVPTAEWTESDVELVLSRAFMWRASFKGATSHFAS